MCEETQNYLWALQDILGHGATSQVYKAYQKSTGELVAAKVYQCSSSSRSQNEDERAQRNRDYRPILDREMDILKSTNHENIIRYIALEPVISSDGPSAVGREALLIEYCNGGSLNHVLEQPENQFGLREDEFMLVFRQLTNALKYLHTKNTIHRDIKPDNIMLSINTNGERTYKLADLGVARLINEGENAFTSLVGTEEYIHPDLYRAAVHDDKRNTLRTIFQTRVDFPFEVDLWSLGVTLYQCATGELPFQPFAGTRKDRAIMKRILETKPPGCISGIEQSTGGKIQWSKTLPDSCRLSRDLKQRLEVLLQRLLEPDRNKLMSFQEYFRYTDQLFHLMPIYYLNLKRFTLTCSYFEPSQSITELYDRLRMENADDRCEEYYCLFQNIPYPVSKSQPVDVKTFCERLPISTSWETPLVFYTFSLLRPDDRYLPALLIPDIKSIRQYNDVAAACDWSKDTVGLFYYIKTQLMEYQRILQTAQCSTTIMQQHLKSNLLEFLCDIRSKLVVFCAIEELKKILDQIDTNISSQSATSLNNSSTNSNNANIPPRKQSASGEAPSIGFSHLYGNNATLNDSNLSPGTVHRAVTSSPMQLIQQSMRIYLRSYIQTYDKLIKCEQDILAISKREFNDNLGQSNDQQPFVNTLWLSNCTDKYSSWSHRADKFLKDVIDLNESFRKDRLLNTYNRLQSDSHFRRRKNLEQLHEKYIDFARNECYQNLVEVFNDYNDWIKKRSNLLNDYQTIKRSYTKQCDDIIQYMDMIDELRLVVYKNIRELSGSASSASDSLQAQPATLRSYPQQYREDEMNYQQQPPPTPPPQTQPSSSGDEDETDPNKKFMQKVRGTTRKTIQQAEEGFMKLDSVIRHLRSNIQRK